MSIGMVTIGVVLDATDPAEGDWFFRNLRQGQDRLARVRPLVLPALLGQARHRGGLSADRAGVAENGGRPPPLLVLLPHG
ncbi:hypothetical protein L6E12_07540 [Actinokineospora sp. PR83]|uniref:hypothetical protein n=1 Tax=Actinokineospora sp. PR83 TaxID=2884908 RepID=UPI001F1F7D78|nr:hypothetical protein [Actinokineospora sp. PR83]MCG8915636.1 hypothetical protein [Actinokineospora sp. PR83]